jgi:hypothetical protein
MPNVINGCAFSFSVVLSEAKDLAAALASHMLACVTIASIVRSFATLGMTEKERADATGLYSAMNQ